MKTKVYTEGNRKQYDKRRYLANAEKMKAASKKRRDENPEKVKASIKKWILANPDKVSAIKKRWLDKNSEKVKATAKKWRSLNHEKTVVTRRLWRKNNPDKLKAENARRLSTAKGKLSNNISCLIRSSLTGNSKAGRHWESLVDFTIDQLKQHLEKLFKQGMTWDNYGTVWEIDHKTPIAVFNYETPDHVDFKLCWSLKNLQPLEAVENRRKQDKIDKPFQPSLLIECA